MSLLFRKHHVFFCVWSLKQNHQLLFIPSSVHTSNSNPNHNLGFLSLSWLQFSIIHQFNYLLLSPSSSPSLFEMSSSNLTGFVLAVVSSSFIGSSFIIKKKGLQLARVNGPSASNYHSPFSFDNNFRKIFMVLSLHCDFQVLVAMVICFSLSGGSEWLPVCTSFFNFHHFLVVFGYLL